MAKKIEVYGRVQGVLFRANVKKYCDSRGIKGKVMNRNDGSVLIIVQCNKNELEGLKSWLVESPGMSEVRKISESEEKGGVIYDDFEIVKEDSFLIDKGKALKNLLKE
jgi:acylphosphatase